MNPKGALLEKNGYRYNFDRLLYINRATKKVFSVRAIEDNTVEWLAVRMAEENDGNWQLYFDQEPSPGVLRDFLAELDGLRVTT